jgi:nucleotide-binding universal stress UspA family protein
LRGIGSADVASSRARLMHRKRSSRPRRHDSATVEFAKPRKGRLRSIPVRHAAVAIAMNYRSLLVLLDHHPACAARVHTAIGLARAFDCHLVGLAPTDLVDLPDLPRSAASISESAAMVWDALRDQAERATEAFRDACHAAGAESFEAVIDEANKIESLIRHARCSDLTILTQADPASPERGVVGDMVESVVLHSARPTLVLPHVTQATQASQATHAMHAARPIRRVLVAYNDTRESARAVADALPLLRAATHVDVAVWGEADRRPESPARRQLDALERWLAWHGVGAETRLEASTTLGIADAILARAADADADLIVMGAYGHSRWAERVLGGATRGLLRSMTVPVLMSH